MKTLSDSVNRSQAFWRIELLGQICATYVQEQRVVSRFRSQKTGALLAYLASFPNKAHPRELLIDLLWPDANPTAGRHNLSNALSSLRHQFEPPGVDAGTVFLATRFAVQINAASVVTDMDEFTRYVRAGEQAATQEEQASHLDRALAVYGGLFCPGYYDEWILTEQQRLQAQFVRALQTVHGPAPVGRPDSERPGICTLCCSH